MIDKEWEAHLKSQIQASRYGKSSMSSDLIYDLVVAILGNQINIQISNNFSYRRTNQLMLDAHIMAADINKKFKGSMPQKWFSKRKAILKSFENPT